MTAGAAKSGARFIGAIPATTLMLTILTLACKNPRRRPAALRAGDEGAQRFRLELNLVEPVLDEIADADDAAEPSVGDDRQMSHAPVRHLGHQLLHGITRRAGHDIARHDLVDAARQQLGATVGQRDDDVALGQDAVDALAILADDNRADALAIERLDSLGDSRAGPDRRDPAAFVAQDCLDIHRELPWRRERRRTLRGAEPPP